MSGTITRSMAGHRTRGNVCASSAATLAALAVAAGLAACGGGGTDEARLDAPRAAATEGRSRILAAGDLTPREQLGKAIFFDQNLSINANQSCASCHGPEAGWTGPDSGLNAGGTVYEGSIPGSFGNRKPPSTAYATSSPILHFTLAKGQARFIGGSFWDGRATGERLGSPAAEQALGPFLNPLEQALPGPADVVQRICAASYAALFLQVAGSDACDADKVGYAFDAIGFAIAAFEGSAESNPFSSKYDAYLRGQVKLSQQEQQGLNLFFGKGKCAACHTLERGKHGELPLLTDFTYDNLGLPRNPDNPFYTAGASFNPLGFQWIDLGLGGFIATRPDYAAFAAANDGRHKVPTLRNVDKRPSADFVKAYGHNGYFKSLQSIVHFYNTRDVKPPCVNAFTREAEALAQGCWPVPEVPVNVNRTELGDLRLNAAQEAAIVAFMKTLSDGYMP